MGFLKFMEFSQKTTHGSLSTPISKLDIVMLATFIIVGCLFVLMSMIGFLQKIDKSMFDNVGKKIKQLARIIIWSIITLSVFASILLLLLCIFNEAFFLLWFVPVVLIVGCLSAWVSFVCLYGFGELIDKLSYIEELAGESSYRLIRNINPSTPNTKDETSSKRT